MRAADAFEREGRWGDASRALVRAAPLLLGSAWRRLALMQRAIDDAARADDTRAIRSCALWNAAGLAALNAYVAALRVLRAWMRGAHVRLLLVRRRRTRRR